ncbi:hypothetical protein J2Z21_000595 [Streptomyces griseochromogenes]|uniref:Uncharacterized protein n=1 Tax=Streptomyces griseochromogenes TaxID=68214 RepID=A0ABS4LJW1_9ACTN|nr:hypothetical protein [Streptomyces griseochromogenes]
MWRTYAVRDIDPTAMTGRGKGTDHNLKCSLSNP